MVPASSKSLWLAIILLFLTLLVSSNVHVLMLLVFDVPYPEPDAPMLAGAVIGNLPFVLAIWFLVFILGSATSQRTIWFYSLFVFLLMALREELLRAPLMSLVANNSPIGPDFLATLPTYVTYLVFGLIVPPLHKYLNLHNAWLKATVLTLITVSVLVVASPLVSSLGQSLMTLAAGYDESVASYYPYGPNVLILAYATFLPKTLAYFGVWHFFVESTLAGNWLARLLYVLGTLFCTTGSLLLLLPFNEDPWALLYASSQFVLEDMSFAILTILFYPWTKRLLRVRVAEARVAT